MSRTISSPHFLDRSRIKQYPVRPRRYRRRPMTIAIGLVCWDGLILATDTEETRGYSKRNMTKLQAFGFKNELTYVIAGAGSTDLMKMFGGAIDQAVWAEMDKSNEADVPAIAVAEMKTIFEKNIV